MVLSISIHFLSLILFYFFSQIVRSERSHKKQFTNHYDHEQNRKQTDFKVRKYHHSHNFSFEETWRQHRRPSLTITCLRFPEKCH